MLQRSDLVGQVIHHIEQAIAAGEFPPGTKLPPEPQLMSRLGVGRSTLREGMRALIHKGLLVSRQGDGTYVLATPAERTSLAERLKAARVPEVHEVRFALEREVARLAALRRTTNDVRKIRGALQARRTALAAGNLQAALDADIALHCAIAAASQNTLMADLYRNFAVALRDALAALWEAEGLPSSAGPDAHDRLVDAIADGDAAAAGAAVDAVLALHDQAAGSGRQTEG
jgi:DNA-binding FadR family transcriptional regulator